MRTTAKRSIDWALLLFAGGVFCGCCRDTVVYVIKVADDEHCQQRINVETGQPELVCTGVMGADTVVVGGGDTVVVGGGDTVVVGGGN